MLSGDFYTVSRGRCHSSEPSSPGCNQNKGGERSTGGFRE